LGIEVTEIVTGFVRSNILHHGLYAPDDSLYLPIKSTMEQIKYNGNKNGMPAELYANSVVRKLIRGKHGAEIWEGHLAWYLRFLVTFCPLAVLVCMRKYPH
jgi:1-acylglycerone phosphate reductase